MPLESPTLPAGVTEDFLFEETLSGAGGELADLAADVGLEDPVIATDILRSTPPLDALPDYEPWPESPAAKDGG